MSGIRGNQPHEVGGEGAEPDHQIPNLEPRGGLDGIVGDTDGESLSRRIRLGVKRGSDILVSAVALLVLAPLLAVIAISVRSGGPVIFRQERIGRHGRPFTMIKFRTMRDGTHDEVVTDEETFNEYSQNGFKLPADDPRITGVGRILRRTSFDELPQLVNIVRGDMSLVGPRPVVQEQLELRDRRHREMYESVRPGLTGLWQVSGRSTLTEHERHEIDAQYVRTWSLRNDARIVIVTPAALMRSEETF